MPSPHHASGLTDNHRAAVWLWAWAAAGLVFAARLAEVHVHAGDVPTNDQWKIEAVDILLPWFEGSLRPGHFLAPHFEHVPVWTRLAAWLQVVVTGKWDPLAQMTCNAALHSIVVALMVHWSVASLRMLPATGVTVLLIALGALPHAWENSTWGFQSQFPFALLFLFLHVRGSFAALPLSRRWWWAQAAGVAGLFTLASMWLAPLAVALVWLWTDFSRKRAVIIPLATALAGLAMIAAIRLGVQPGVFAHNAVSPLQFLHAALDQLGWPTGWSGGAVLINLPLVLFALQLRRRAEAGAFDRIVLALGIWALGQALALAYARGTGYSGYVSRYGDLLAIGVIANALALVRLRALAHRWPALPIAAGLAWGAAVGAGLFMLSTTGHTRYFHEHAAGWASTRRTAVQAFLERGDRSLLDAPATRAILFQATDDVVRVLQNPDLVARLPASVNPAAPAGAFETGVRALQSHWRSLAAIAGGLLLVGIMLRGRGSQGASTPLVVPLRADRFQIVFFGALGMGAGGLLLLWPNPFVFSEVARFERLLKVPGANLDVGFDFVGEAPVGRERLWGAADIRPPEFRNWFAGTRPDPSIPAATVQSRPLPVTAARLILPVAGFPASPGNALWVRFEESNGQTVGGIPFAGENPRDIFYWELAVTPYHGKNFRVVLEDGRGDTEDWLAVGPPIQTDDPGLAERLTHWLGRERFGQLHRTLGWIALTGLVGAASLASMRRFSRTSG